MAFTRSGDDSDNRGTDNRAFNSEDLIGDRDHQNAKKKSSANADNNQDPTVSKLTGSDDCSEGGAARTSQESKQLANEVDELQRHLGGFGRYQMLLYILLSLIYMRGGWHVWIPIYQGWTPLYHCSASPGLALNESVPSSEEDGVLTYAECEQYVNLSVSNATQPCSNGWTYEWDSDYTSVVSWLDLVCDAAYQVELTTTMYMVGATCGVIFLAPLSDRFGSKLVMLVCLAAQAVVGTALIWAADIAVFCILKFLIGATNMTIAICAYVLMTETFDAAHRDIPTIAMQVFWVLGILSLALMAYLIPAWQDLELAISLPINILAILFASVIPDSLPWLLSKGKLRQAEAVINRYVRINKLPPIPDLDVKLSKFSRVEQTSRNKVSACASTNSDAGDETPSEVYTVLTLFKTPKLRKITFIMFYLFLVNALAYFGIMYSTPELAGDRFLNLALLGLVEVPAYFFCMVANRIIGRRRSMCIFLLFCAVPSIIVLFIPEDLGDLHTGLVMVGKFGITGSYVALYLYAAEVYPTVIRNQAVGASSFFENIGGIAAPNMVYVENSLNNLSLGIFGGMTIVGSMLVLLLPETHNKPMPQTVEDVEAAKPGGDHSGCGSTCISCFKP